MYRINKCKSSNKKNKNKVADVSDKDWEEMKWRRHSVIADICIGRYYALRLILSRAALINGTRLCNGLAIFRNGCCERENI